MKQEWLEPSTMLLRKHMSHVIWGSIAAIVGFGQPLPLGMAAEYFPPPGSNWARCTPGEAGFDLNALESAVAYAKAHPIDLPYDLLKYVKQRGTGPYDEIVGPTKRRGDINGLILRHGCIVNEFGETQRIDMAFSVTKSFLSTLAGIALDEQLIDDLHQPVYLSIDDDRFEGPRHSRITWHHLLQQTSEWEGTLWDKPDQADRRKGIDRDLQDPGSFWEYNDVRVNLTALALLELWGKPLPEVLKERVMDPIGATDQWQWHGYTNSKYTVNGRQVESVSGGGHWGGGLWISAEDMARFGLLFLNEGRWKDGQQIFSSSWIEKLRQPVDVEPRYGYMWWLNTDRIMWPDVPGDSYAARGSGGNIIWVYPKKDLVVVIRWIDRDAINGYLERIVAAIKN